ncbi:sel1 repeat family protein [Candidatus Gracilibacteria bacterium]|nr:sel1 repeat family protein [Candidatus Gracilibacteria bacterium]
MLYTLEKDYKNGFYWFSEAVNDGSYDAKSFLGLYHLQGLGRTKNVQRALSYLKEAAREGSIPAAFHLGIIYATGHHGAVKPDFEASIALMKLAKEEGYPRAEDFYYRLLQVKMEKGVEKFHSAIENATKQPVRQQISSSDWLTGFLKDLEAALTIGIVAGVVIGGVSSFLDDDGGSETNSTSSGRNTTSVKFNVQNTIDISPVLRITDHPSHVICETNKYGLATIIITKSNKTAAGWYAFDFFLDNKNESGYSFSGKFYLDGSKSHYQITLIPHQNKFKEYKPY